MNSMTGFGRANLEKNSREYVVEIKSVNHKYNDISVKAPRNLLAFEDKIRKTVLSNITRGKIDIYITYSNFGTEGRKIVINKDLAKLYIQELKDLATENNISDDIKVTEISKFPDVLNVENVEEQDNICDEVLECLELALEKFTKMRNAEGIKIKEDLQNRIKKVEEQLEKIVNDSSTIVQEYIEKLENRVNEILKTDVVDKNRLAQEIVIYSDKCSIEEELTRLNSHISQFKNLIEENEPIGKKIDFLIQEMNREVNTIGSKSGSIQITNAVIELKTVLEDIREQIQNIE